MAGPNGLICFLFGLLGGFLGLLVLVRIIFVFTFLGVLRLIVLANVHQRVVGFFVALFQGIHIFYGGKDVQEFLIAASDPNELVLHGLNGFDDFLAFEGVREIGDCEQKMLFLKVGMDICVSFLLVLIFLEEFGL